MVSGGRPGWSAAGCPKAADALIGAPHTCACWVLACALHSAVRRKAPPAAGRATGPIARCIEHCMQPRRCSERESPRSTRAHWGSRGLHTLVCRRVRDRETWVKTDVRCMQRLRPQGGGAACATPGVHATQGVDQSMLCCQSLVAEPAGAGRWTSPVQVLTCMWLKAASSNPEAACRLSSPAPA